MIEREFNLLDEPWIVVLRKDGSTDKLSLTGALARAADFRCLAGELPTQDAAIMRLLLAVLHTVVSRYAPDGTEAPIASASQALKRWKAIWDAGAFPMEIVQAYLNRWHDRFWLFDAERPFFQVPHIGKATEYTAAKLNGELNESENKIRLFSQRCGQEKNTLEIDEAVRWLVCLNAYDDCATKPTPKLGWMGMLGLIFANGENLFKTLMLNLILLKDGNELWESEKPAWEQKDVKYDVCTMIPMPDNLSELYTLQSRRILFKRNGEKVESYLVLGGDFFQKDNAFAEQMTVWRNAAKNDKVEPLYHPRRHDPSRQIWRDFGSLVAQKQGGHRPGVVSWIARLKREGILKEKLVKFATVSVMYQGVFKSSIDDVFSDTLSFSAEILTEKGERWIPLVLAEIETSDKFVSQLAYLAQRIAKAAGDSDGLFERNAAKEMAYYRLDMPFREWLEGIDAENDEQAQVAERWWNTAQPIIRSVGKELIAAAGPQALTGRTLIENKKEIRYCAPEAYNYFLYCTASREALATGGKKNG
ncbi:MAG: type I-E CRISPR-associated protein Cse1/CasA [Clostridia bacterium]|nr:type I-E CRISPR-associated protein Cse1/CasA [Clostridia bacterium]